MTKKQANAEHSLEFIEGVKRRWMATVDAIVDPLMLIDKDFTILQTNQAMAKHANKNIRNLVGSKCYKTFAGRDKPCSNCKLIQGIESQSPQTFELENTHYKLSFEVTTQPIFDAKGEIEGSLHIYRDRTLAKQMQTQLVQNEKLASIGLLAGGIAHELNNPLGGILLFSQMLLRSIPKESSHFEDVQEIELAAKRCKAIVENLLEFARQQPTKNESSERVDIKEAMELALRFCRVGGKTNKYTISEDFSESGPLHTLGNKNKIVQVFLNLMQNALQAMPKGGRLNLRGFIQSQEEQQWIVAEIEDSGIGISPENIKKIFDPFYTSKSVGEGTGLGLSICHGIVQDLGGKIEVKSKLGKGSSFKVYFPIVPLKKDQGKPSKLSKSKNAG